MGRVRSDQHYSDEGSALLASPVRRSIVELLQRQPEKDDADTRRAGGMTAAQLAERLGLHVTTLRFHLDQLERAGLITSHFTTVYGVGRPRKIYALAHPSARFRDDLSHMIVLARLLTTSVSAHLTPDQAGHQWARENVVLPGAGPATTAGAWLTKIGRLVDVLQHWGYQPELTTSDGGRSCRIDLVDCPFLDLAQANPDVVCGIHRGLLSGVLEQLGEDRVEVSLRPFVDPGLCHAQITTHQPFHTTSEDLPDAP